MSKKSRHRMSHDETMKLIRCKIDLDHLFTSKFYDKKAAWQQIKERAGLCNSSADQIKIRWGNLWKKYKDLLNPPTGRGTEDDGLNAESWPYFEVLHEFAATQHTVNPPIIIDSSSSIRVNPRNSFGGVVESSQDFDEMLDISQDLQLEYLFEDEEMVLNSNKTQNQASTSSGVSSVPSTSRVTSTPTSSIPNSSGLRNRNSETRKKHSSQEIFAFIKKTEKRRKTESKAFFSILGAFAAKEGITMPDLNLSNSSNSE